MANLGSEAEREPLLGPGSPGSRLIRQLMQVFWAGLLLHIVLAKW
uniref:Major facilitator superfamily domain containing 8 n=1 Tax=Mus musculus TaxID=10090 RepID=A0A0N4SVE9_MOUSE